MTPAEVLNHNLPEIVADLLPGKVDRPLLNIEEELETRVARRQIVLRLLPQVPEGQLIVETGPVLVVVQVPVEGVERVRLKLLILLQVAVEVRVVTAEVVRGPVPSPVEQADEVQPSLAELLDLRVV